MELEFASTPDLIKELMNRQTFVGLIICSEDENKHDTQCHEKFKFYSTSDIESTLAMLRIAVQMLKEQNK